MDIWAKSVLVRSVTQELQPEYALNSLSKYVNTNLLSGF